LIKGNESFHEHGTIGGSYLDSQPSLIIKIITIYLLSSVIEILYKKVNKDNKKIYVYLKIQCGIEFKVNLDNKKYINKIKMQLLKITKYRYRNARQILSIKVNYKEIILHWSEAMEVCSGDG